MSDNKEVDEQWLERADIANYIAHQAQISPEQKVPAWDRGKAFSSDHQPWWQWQGLPAMSMAFSIFAICLVLMKVELVIKPEGVLLTFAGSTQNTERQTEKINNLVDEKLDLKLREFANEQQVILAHYTADFSTKFAMKQQDNNLQLASYIIGASRQERKEDMTDFISYINDQRKNEKLDQTIKFDQLERAINYQAINQNMKKSLKRKVNNNINMGESGLTLKPANWISEE